MMRSLHIQRTHRTTGLPAVLLRQSRCIVGAVKATVPAAVLAVGLLAGARDGVAQAIPAASATPISTGFQLPTAAGSLQYSVSASENLTSGYYAGTGWQSATGLSGNLAVITSSKPYPFSLIVSAGHFFSTSAEPENSYVNMAMSQVVNTRNWTLMVADSVGYLPATPSIGLGGVPGTGDLGVPPVQVGVDLGQGVLTNYSTRVNNAVSLNIQRHLTGKTSVNIGGSYSIFRFVGSSSGVGLDSNSYTGSAGLSHTLNPRTTLSATYTYSRYTYKESLTGFPGFRSQTVSLGVTHQLSRRASIDFFAGPQWTVTKEAGYPTVNSTNIYLQTDLNYQTRLANLSAGYTRSSNSGYGVTQGAQSDSVRFNGSKTFSRVWNASLTASYTHSTAIQTYGLQQFAPNTNIDGVQVSRALAHSLSAYAAYTLEKQSGVGQGSIFDVFSGSFQMFAFGITYAPPAKHFGAR